MNMNLTQKIMALAVSGAVAAGCGTPNHSTTPEEISIDQMVAQANTETAKDDILTAAVLEGKSQNPDHYRSVIDSLDRRQLYSNTLFQKEIETADKIKTPEGTKAHRELSSDAQGAIRKGDVRL